MSWEKQLQPRTFSTELQEQITALYNSFQKEYSDDPSGSERVYGPSYAADMIEAGIMSGLSETDAVDAVRNIAPLMIQYVQNSQRRLALGSIVTQSR